MLNKNFPTPANGNPGPYYCSTDHEAIRAGCPWGLILAHVDERIYVLTNIGVRYYAIPEHHEILTPTDERYNIVHGAWQACISQIAEFEKHLPPAMR